MGSCLDLDLLDVEGHQDRIWERSAARAARAHPSSSGKDESIEVSVVVAVMGRVRPRSDRLGNVVLAADESGSVHIEVLPNTGVLGTKMFGGTRPKFFRTTVSKIAAWRFADGRKEGATR